jgi:hypothetical protein
MHLYTVIGFSFRIIKWRLEEFKKTDRKKTRQLTIYGRHCPREDRLYINGKGEEEASNKQKRLIGQK